MLTHSTQFRRSLCLAGVALAAVAVASGCSSRQSRVAALRANPSPSEDTGSFSSDVIQNNLTVVADTDFRMMNEDLGRFFLLDRPSRLTPRSLPY